jgi:hypothetical protein
MTPSGRKLLVIFADSELIEWPHWAKADDDPGLRVAL